MSADPVLDLFDSPLDGTRLIEASAGTGKTWNICGLYLRLLLERRLTVQQILVVTFTKAATAELRERIRQRIVEVLAGLRAPAGAAPGADPFVPGLLARLRDTLALPDGETVPALEQALQTFDEASIFTIHGFCQRALADTPFAARLPLVQELLQDDRPLRMEVVHDFWRQQVAGAQADPALVAHLLACGDCPAYYARLLQRQLARPLSRLIWPAGIDAPLDSAADAVAVAFDHARGLWQADGAAIHALLLAALKRLNGTVYRRDGVQLARDGWQALLTGPAPTAITTLPPKLALFGSATLALRANKGQTPPQHVFFDAAQALLDALATQQDRLARARLRLVRSLLTDGATALREAKRSRRVLAFDDMLFNLYQRLGDEHGPQLAAALKARFPAALIDEFQDTDPLQFAVFRAIYRDGDTQNAPLCLVGDPKQAIYSFRHADLHTYLRARAQASARFTLRANQRSIQPLIDALNRLFGCNPLAFMQPGLDFHAVAKGERPQPALVDASEARAALQVWTLPAERRSGQPLAKADAMAAAAAVCAGEVARLLTEAAAGRITLGGRPLRAGDIAVLVRTHAQGSRMRQALAALGVGSVELSQASVFTSPDAEELERLLAAVLEPSREGLLKAALATRCQGFDATQIEALGADEPALAALLQRFAQYQALWRQRGVGFMLRQWLHQERVAQRLLAAADGQRRLTNLLHLAECLHQAAAEHPAPETLLRWLQAQREGDGVGDDATQLRLESDRNLVQIVTIHKSKGLEYPLVFCPFLWDGRLRPADDGLEGAARHDDAGDGLVDFRAGLDPDFDAAAARDEARQEAAAEFMRLVYVALTRAQHRCYLVAGSYRNRAGKGWSTREGGCSGLNWLVAGDGLTPQAWVSARRKPAEPAAIDAAWQALARSVPAGVIHAAALPAPWRLPLPGRTQADSAPQALPPPASLGPVWSIGSYSALLRGPGAAPTLPGPPLADSALAPEEQAAITRNAADHDLLTDLQGAGADTPIEADGPASLHRPPLLAADDILGFPRGAQAGECVHAALEWAEFTDPGSWPAAAERAVRQYPPSSRSGDATLAGAQLQRMLADVLATPLPLGTDRPLRLADLPPGRRLAELEFHLAVPRLDAAALDTTLARLGYDAPALDFRRLEGYLKGYIDLVFEHEGRYFIADWKSNHLGDRAADYESPALDAAMLAHHYHLQYLLYCVALHRWLGRRLTGYRYEHHVGGVAYLFVRGVRPSWRDASGRPTGVFFHRPAAQAITTLSALLGGEGSAA